MERKLENLWLTEAEFKYAWIFGLLCAGAGIIVQAAIWYGIGDALMALWNVVGAAIVALWTLIGSIAAPVWTFLTAILVFLGIVAGFILMFGSLALIPVGIVLIGVWWHRNREPPPTIGGN